MRGESEWTDLQIKDLSDKGLMAEADCPPPRGHYVEIRRFGHILIGVVVWSKGNRFGVALAEEADIDGLIAGAKPCASDPQRNLAKRAKPRVLVLSTPSDWQWAGKALERCALIAVGVIGAMFIGELVYESLSTPLEQIVDALQR